VTINQHRTYISNSTCRPLTTESSMDRAWRSFLAGWSPAHTMMSTNAASDPADPVLKDVSDGPSSGDSLMKQLIRTLHSACRILERLDASDVQSLRDNPQYTARLEQLMAPIGHSVTSTIQKGHASSPGKAARPGNDGEHRTKRSSTSCKSISSD